MRQDDTRTVYDGQRLQVYVRDRLAELIMNRLYARGGRGAKAPDRAYRGLAGNPRTGVVSFQSPDDFRGRAVDIIVDDNHVARIYQQSDTHQGSIGRYIKDWAIQTRLAGKALEAQRQWDRNGWITIEEVDVFFDPPALD